MDPTNRNNPCAKLWSEYLAREINLEQLLHATYVYALDNCDFEFESEPLRPSEILMAESRLEETLRSEEDPQVKASARHELKRQLKKRHPGYYKALDEVEAKNRSNISYLKEIKEFFKDKPCGHRQKAENLLFNFQEAA